MYFVLKRRTTGNRIYLVVLKAERGVEPPSLYLLFSSSMKKLFGLWNKKFPKIHVSHSSCLKLIFCQSTHRLFIPALKWSIIDKKYCDIIFFYNRMINTALMVLNCSGPTWSQILDGSSIYSVKTRFLGKTRRLQFILTLVSFFFYISGRNR